MTDLAHEGFGRKVREERMRRGWSIDEASRRGGASYKTWQRIENGQPIQDTTFLKVDTAFAMEPGTALTIWSGGNAWPAVAESELGPSALSALEQGRAVAINLSDDKATAYGYLLAVVDTVIQQLRAGGAS